MREKMQAGSGFVAWHPNNDETEIELLEVPLMLQVAIDRHEDVKLLLGQHEQWAVIGAPPAGLCNGSNGMAGERFDDSRVNALV